ncbi:MULTISPECIES: ammonia-dependent NAD(+) synthetase [unclassified Mesorhizobium]|uniref:ammonia-dependent NAD(+) synthetase n=1 Tax=unclassified Mesorhizobium TaxID=325217 RepID=UPI00112C8E34|nr:MULTISPECIES: ammonia-dependent NAD(+) synthetase [unclassified Mesorhizobium]MBZ9974134.1 ammonia-dependent NAD(+) synthetase [Mesorhizobium sp. BR-1-1-10]TPK10351.1 ammonia-dependent NAD(+) synthetase [Mesorhizobium sp. B2-5-7]
MTQQEAIISALGVAASFDAAAEARRRIDFLSGYLRAAGLCTYVLGISGGVDSLAAALLAQQAVSELRRAGYDAKFLAVRLPYGTQADEKDAQRALETIGADEAHRLDIKPAADAMLDSIRSAGVELGNARREDFLLGNIKARQRMIAQFTLAAARRGLVIGTDHAAEAMMGFFTKFGDGAADILPLAGLNKRRVRALAAHLGAPPQLVNKVPTADLENLVPLRPDEDAYGVTYDQIDDFLEGKEIDEAARKRILDAYLSTAHKRSLPVAPDLPLR